MLEGIASEWGDKVDVVIDKKIPFITRADLFP